MSRSEANTNTFVLPNSLDASLKKIAPIATFYGRLMDLPHADVPHRCHTLGVQGANIGQLLTTQANSQEIHCVKEIMPASIANQRPCGMLDIVLIALHVGRVEVAITTT